MRWWRLKRRARGLARHALSWPNTKQEDPSMVKFAGYLVGERKTNGNGQTVTNSQNKKHDGVEDDEIYLVVVVVDAKT